jgi:hypothetical protein
MLYVVGAFLAILTFAFLVYAAVRWTRPGSPVGGGSMAVWRDRRRADLGDGLALMSRRFPPPWTVEETNVRGSASIGN